MILMLFIILLMLLMFSTVWYCKKEKSIFNHFSIFSGGFSLYFIMPMIIGEWGFLNDNHLFSTFNYLYARISTSNKLFYLLFIFLTYLGFVIGNYLFYKRKQNNKFEEKSLKDIKIIPYRQIILGVVLILLSIVVIIKFYPYFFSGYRDNINRGTFAALLLLNTSFLIFYNVNKYQKEKNLKKTIFNIYNLIFIILNILLLSIGTRMYFLASVLMGLVLLEQYIKIDSKKVTILFGILVVIIAVVGLLRSNYSVSIYNGLVTNLMEFMYTFISSLKFMELGINEIINFPKFLFSEVINLVPTFMLPDKLSYILNPASSGYVIYSPEGALSAYVDLTINFGLIGSAIFSLIMGYVFQVLRKHRNKILVLVIYSMLCGFIGFSFFRDGFVTSIIKNILEFSVIVPCLYYLFLTLKIRRKNEKNITDKCD